MRLSRFRRITKLRRLRVVGALVGTGAALVVMALVRGEPGISTIELGVLGGISGSIPTGDWGTTDIGVVSTYTLLLGAGSGWLVAPTATGKGLRRAATGAFTATVIAAWAFWQLILILIVIRLLASPPFGGVLALSWTFAIGNIVVLTPAIALGATSWVLTLRAVDRALRPRRPRLDS